MPEINCTAMCVADASSYVDMYGENRRLTNLNGEVLATLIASNNHYLTIKLGNTFRLGIELAPRESRKMV